MKRVRNIMESKFDMVIYAACLLLMVATMGAKSVSILVLTGIVSTGPLRE